MEPLRESNHDPKNGRPRNIDPKNLCPKMGGTEESRAFEHAPFQKDNKDFLLTESHFSGSVSKDSLKWTRPFTKLVSRMPYLGDVVIYRGLSGIYKAQDKESLSKAMDAFQSRIFLLTVIHVGMAAIIASELNKDVGALSEGSIEKIPEIVFESGLLAVFSAVTASQLILYRRIKNRVDRIKEREERFFVTHLSPPTNQSIILGVLLFLGSSVAFNLTIDKERVTPSKTPSGEVKTKSSLGTDKAK